MNAKTIIIICLVISSNKLHAEENVTHTISLKDKQNDTSKIEKKIDLSPSNSGSTEVPGLLSKLNNLFFGSNSEDAEAEETHQVPSIQYGPPQGQQIQPVPHSGRNAQQRDCNPCNKEPWVPIMRSYGHNQIVGYDINVNHGGGNNGGLYNQNNIATDSYGTPLSHGYQDSGQSLKNLKPPSVDYGSLNIGISAVQDLYSPPVVDVGLNYGAPSVPSETYGPSQGVQANYSPPPEPQTNYGPPSGPQTNYGLPPVSNYGPPVSSIPSGNYGPPVNYVPPPTYGPPKVPPTKYGAPNNFISPSNYGPPPSSNYGPPPQPSLDYGAPVTAPAYTAPGGFNEAFSVQATVAAPPPAVSNFGTHYGPPKPIYKIPAVNYGPPVNQHNFGHSKPGYPSGKSPRQIRPNYQPRPYQPFGPLQSQPTYKYIPLHKGKFINLPTNFKPPPPPPNYNPGGSTFASFGNFGNIDNFGNFGNIGVSQNFKPPQITNPEYLPPKEELPIATGHNAEPIALPNLSSRPVAPLHNAQNFHDNFPQPDSHVEVQDSNVQIQQSIPVAEFLASIEHPINVIRSPILDVTVANSSSQSDYYTTVSPGPVLSTNNYFQPINLPINPPINQPINKPTGSDNYDDYRLSDNPIVVEDTHVAAATNQNRTVANFNNLQSSEQIGEEFIQDILYDINRAKQDPLPTPSVPFTSMQPPPIGDSFWATPNQRPYNSKSTNFDGLVYNYKSTNFDELANSARNVESSTKKPKQIQIIIPYTTNNEYDTKILKPSQDDPFQGVTHYQQQPSITSPNVVNIQDLFKNNQSNEKKNLKDLPFDIIHLQKNIDGWTEQEYSRNILENTKTSALTTLPTTKFIPSKRIPDNYLTTLPYNLEIKSSTSTSTTTTTTTTTPKYVDHEPAGSNSKEYLESNLIATTEEPTTSKYLSKNTKFPSWDKIHIAVSPLTKEKIYVVTPQPKLDSTGSRQSRDNDNSTFSISILPMRNKTAESNDVRVVLSEWPHLINNLATITKSTATSTTTPRSTSRHPLFGLMDLTSYTPPANSTIETYSGHSKVINVATASLKKRSTTEEVATTVSPTLN